MVGKRENRRQDVRETLRENERDRKRLRERRQIPCHAKRKSLGANITIRYRNRKSADSIADRQG